jgi:hypothetical protein
VSNLDDHAKRLPTPMARVAQSLHMEGQLGPDHARDIFDAAIGAIEAWMKYTCVVLLAVLRRHEPEQAYLLEYGLANSSAIGDWARSINITVSHLLGYQHQSDVFAALTWLNNAYKPAATPAWLETFRSDVRVVLEKFSSDVAYDQPRRVLDVLPWIVQIRNKRAHCPQLHYFFADTFQPLYRCAEFLFESSPVLSLELLGRMSIQGKSLLLQGPAPATLRVHESQAWPQNKGKSVDICVTVKRADGTMELLGLPRLVHYSEPNSVCMFVNSGPNGEDKHEFINYHDGKTARYALSDYAVEPRPAIPESLDIIAFPKADAVAIDNAWPIYAQQTLRPRLVNEMHAKSMNVGWKAVDFNKLNIVRVPPEPGLYAFVSHCCAAGLEAHTVVGYVGQASSLQSRFQDYLSEKIDTQGREQVVQFLSEFRLVKFWYAAVKSQSDRDTLEDWIIKAIDPPGNMKLKLVTV